VRGGGGRIGWLRFIRGVDLSLLLLSFRSASASVGDNNLWRQAICQKGKIYLGHLFRERFDHERHASFNELDKNVSRTFFGFSSFLV
jgi:hypothetical protein